MSYIVNVYHPYVEALLPFPTPAYLLAFRPFSLFQFRQNQLKYVYKITFFTF